MQEMNSKVKIISVLLCLFSLSFCACYNHSKSVANEIANIYKEGIEKAKKAKSVKELGDLTREIKRRVDAVDKDGVDSNEIPKSEQVEFLSIQSEYYDAVNASVSRLTEGKTAVWDY